MARRSVPVPEVRRILRDDAADTVRGIAIVAVAYFVMTVGDVAAKWALPVAGVTGAMIWRGVFGAMTVGAVAARSRVPGRQGWRRLVPVRWRLVLLRSALHSFVSVAWYVAWMTMSLADSYAVGFTSPLLITLLAVPMLGERIRWRRALSTAVGFAGVLIMLRPGGDLWTPAVPLLLLGILALAISRVMNRLLSTTETPECLAFWMLLAHVPLGVALLPWLPRQGVFGPMEWAAMLILGVSNGLAHCMMSRSYALAPVSALAPYEYTTMLWGGALGFLVFRDVPSWSTLAGAAVVAAAGLYNLHRERLRRTAECRAAAAPPAAVSTAGAP